uniref:Tropomyosin n=1 Tax=Ditylenchus dipsaci TaxID=166011 RepID=A0A915D3B8_9BILA
MAVLQELKAKFDEELSKISQLEKDRSRCLMNRRQLESQLTENNMVKEELERLEPTAEARENVRKRIEYITTEITRVESVLADSLTQIESQKESAEKARDNLKALLSKSSN